MLKQMQYPACISYILSYILYKPKAKIYSRSVRESSGMIHRSESGRVRKMRPYTHIGMVTLNYWIICN